MSTRSSKRVAVTAGVIGLVAGIALGATSLASAVSPSPTPKGLRIHGFGLAPGMKMAERRGTGGLVTAVSATSLSLRTPAGARSIGLSSATSYFTGRTRGTASAVTVGEIVRVLLADPKATSPVASVVVVVPAHVAGWVTAVDGSTITLTDVSGFTRKVITSSSTVVRKDGAASTLSAISVGTFVHATGKVDADGTSLDAARIGIGRPAKTGVPGQRLRRGFGQGFGQGSGQGFAPGGASDGVPPGPDAAVDPSAGDFPDA